MNLKHSLARVSLVVLTAIFSGCMDSNTSSNTGNNGVSAGVSGEAQKGPFKAGSTVTAFKLVDGVRSSNEQIKTTVLDNTGKYDLKVPWNGPTEIVISGDYYNEATGLYTEDGNLSAVVNMNNSSDISVNINILTHLAAGKIKEDLKTNIPIQTAKNNAKQAVAKTLDIDLGNANLEELDLTDGSVSSTNRVANTKLLQVSAALLQTSDPFTTLSSLEEDLKDGNVDGDGLAVLQEVKEASAKVDLADVASKLQSTLNIENVPNSSEIMAGTLAFNHNIRFKKQKNLHLNTSYTSESLVVEGIYGASGTTLSITGGEYSLDGGEWVSSDTNLTNGQRLQLRHNTASTYATSTSTTLSVGGSAIVFETLTMADPSSDDSVPDSFVFDFKKDQNLSTIVESEVITLTGMTTAASISIDKGEFRVNDGNWTNVSTTVENTDTLQVRHTSADNFFTKTKSVINVGGEKATFISYTKVEDTTPDYFSFSSAQDALPNTEVVSEKITITGINTPTSIRVEGGEFRVNEGAYTNAPTVIENNASVELRTQSSAKFNDVKRVVLRVGKIQESFLVFTKADDKIADTTPAPFSFTLLKDQNLSTNVQSNEVIIRGINRPTPISIQDGFFSINGAAFTNVASTVENEDRVIVRHESADEFLRLKRSVLFVGGLNADFISYTKEQDLRVEPFFFELQEGVAPNSVRTSNEVLIEGINVAAPIEVQNATYSINDAAFTQEKGVINNGDRLRVRHTSSADAGKVVVSHVRVGHFKSAFISTTTYEAPTLTGTPASQVALGESYSFKPDSTGEVAQWSIQNKPSWAYFNEFTGELYGVPQGNKNQKVFSNIIISAKNSGATVSLPAFSITVGSPALVVSQASYKTLAKRLVEVSIVVTGEVATPSGWSKTGSNPYTFTKTYTSNTNENVVFVSSDGARFERSIQISSIAPQTQVGQAQYVNLDKSSVQVSIVVTGEVATPNGWSKAGSNPYTFTKLYTANTTEKVVFIDDENQRFEREVVVSTVAPLTTVANPVYKNLDKHRVEVSILVNGVVNTPNGWSKTGSNPYTYTKIYTANATESVVFIDEDGARFSRVITVSGVTPPDSTKPRIVYEQTALKKDVVNEKIALDASFSIVFNEALDASSLSSESVYLTKNGVKIAATVVLDKETNIVITPTDALSSNSEYKLLVTDKVEDLAGNSFDVDILSSQNDAIFTFTTVDKIGPKLLSSNPVNTATGVNVDASLSLSFDEALKESSLTSSTLLLKDESANTVSAQVRYGNKVITVAPDNALEPLKTYTLTLTTGILDVSDNAFESQKIITFTTGVPSDSIAHNGFVYKEVISPKTGKTWLDRNLGASAVCASATQESCFGDYFQWGRKSNGHEKKDSKISNKDLSQDVDQNATFIAIDHNPYMWRESKDENLWKGVSASNGVCPTGFRVPSSYELKAEFNDNDSNNPINNFLKLPTASYRDGRTGTMASAKVSMLWSSDVYSTIISFEPKVFEFNDKVRFTEVVSTQGIAVRCIKDYNDSTAPTVVNVSVGNNEQNVSLENDIRVTFSEHVRADSVLSNVSLKADGQSALKPRSYADKVATFSRGASDKLLDFSRTYTLTVPTTVVDVAGNGLEQDFTLSFKTVLAPDTTLPQLDYDKSNLKYYSSSNGNIAVDTNLTLVFSEEMNVSSLTKENLTLNPNTAHELIVKADKKTVVLKPSTTFSYNTDYTLRVSENITDLVGNKFNGSTYGNSEGSKTLEFTTVQAPDTTAPSITESKPADGASDVGVNANLEVTFDEEVQDVNTTTVVLTKDSDDSVVATQVSYNKKVALINPTQNLEKLTAYTLTLKSGIKDMAKVPNALAQTTINFTTANVAASCTGREMAGVCYELVQTKKTWQDAKQSCEAENKTLLSKDLSINWKELAQALSFNQDEKYWLEEESSSSAAYMLRYNEWSSNPWGSASGYTKTDSYYYLCMSEKTAPSISAQDVANNATDVSTKFKTKITFSEAVKGFDASSVVLEKASDNTKVALNLSFKDKVLTVVATQDLETSTEYLLTLKSAITDKFANPLTQTQVRFTTSSVAATCAGEVIDGVCYSVHTEAKNFADARAFCALSNETLIAKDSISSWSSFASTMSLESAQKYWLRVSAASNDAYYLRDSYGWGSTSSYSTTNKYHFICMSKKVQPAVSNVEPANNSSDISTKAKFKLTFSEEMKEISSADVSLEKDADSSVIALNISLDASKKVLTLTPTQDLETATNYSLKLKTSITDLYANKIEASTYNFTTSAVATTCAGSLIDGVCYVASTQKKTHTAAKSACRASNMSLVARTKISDADTFASTMSLNKDHEFWLQDKFDSNSFYYLRNSSFGGWSTSSSASKTYEKYYFCMSEKTKPTLSSAKPADNDVDVSTKTKIKLTFSKAIKVPAKESVIFVNASDEAIAYEMSLDESEKVLSITPQNDLATSTRYTLTLKPTLTDVYANALAEHAISFTTSSVASTCAGAELGGKCYTLVSTEKNWTDATAHCSGLFQSLVSKTGADFASLASALELNDSKEYWLKEEDSYSAWANYLRKSFSGWSTSTGGKSYNKPFICVK